MPSLANTPDAPTKSTISSRMVLPSLTTGTEAFETAFFKSERTSSVRTALPETLTVKGQSERDSTK